MSSSFKQLTRSLFFSFRLNAPLVQNIVSDKHLCVSLIVVLAEIAARVIAFVMGTVCVLCEYGS
jgi:hypothetical protein